MGVSNEALDAVMDKEDREKYLSPLVKELAQRHILRRMSERLRAEVAQNDLKISALDLLSGGTQYSWNRKITYLDLSKDIQNYLVWGYTHPDVVPGNFYREFAKRMHEEFPVTDDAMDMWAEKTVELVERHAHPDAASFRMWAVFNGNWKEMIDTLAPRFGFEKLDGKK